MSCHTAFSRLSRWLALGLGLASLVLGMQAAAAAESGVETLALNQRQIVSFRATLLGDTPAERAALARQALAEVAAAGRPAVVSRTATGAAVRFEVEGVGTPTVSLEDLMASKRTGHPQDVADLLVLEEIRRMR